MLPEEHPASCPTHLGTGSPSHPTALLGSREACPVCSTSAREKSEARSWGQSWELVQCLRQGPRGGTRFGASSAMLMLFLFRRLISAAQRSVLC